MEKNNFLFILIFSLISSSLIFLFGIFLWGIFFINASAYFYYLLINNKLKITILSVLFISLFYIIFPVQYFLFFNTLLMLFILLYLFTKEVKNG